MGGVNTRELTVSGLHQSKTCRQLKARDTALGTTQSETGVKAKDLDQRYHKIKTGRNKVMDNLEAPKIF